MSLIKMASTVICKEAVLEQWSKCLAIKYLLSDNSDEEDEVLNEHYELFAMLYSKRYINALKPVPKNHGFVSIIGHLGDQRFRRYARTTPESFAHLLLLVQDHEVFKAKKGRPQIEVYMQLLIALYRFGHCGNSSSIVEVASRFGISDGGAVTDCTKRVIMAITSLSSRFIKWPTASERSEITSEMGRKGVPNCVGFIDGSHIRLVSEPVENGISYYNRKSFYSLNLAAIVNFRKEIIGFQLGFPGKVHDMTVFKSMNIYKKPHLYFGENEYIIGDPAYALSKHMITPFRQSLLCSKLPSEWNGIRVDAATFPQ